MKGHDTGIEWTHIPGYRGATWNPYVGCSRVSPGCQHCYAEHQAWRIVVQSRALGRTSVYDGTVEIIGGKLCGDCDGLGVVLAENGEPGAWCETCWGFLRVGGEPRWTGEINDAGKLDLPMRTRRPHVWFINSMSDLFHERVTDEQIAGAFGVMAACPQHIFVVLTKRIERAPSWLEWLDAISDRGAPPVGRLPWWRALTSLKCAETLGVPFAPDAIAGAHWPLPNVFIGPSVEDQQRADERMPYAMQLAAAGWRVVVSAEPLLGTVDFGPWIDAMCEGCGERVGSARGDHSRLAHATTCDGTCRSCPVEVRCGPVRERVSWLLIGAESGANRRPCEVTWVASAVEQARAAGVPAFVKQGSAHKPGQQGNLPDELWSIKQFPERRA